MVSLSLCGVLRGPYSKYMTRIDLHTHSAYSDGTDTPAELMEKARQAHLDVVGLTDHDTYAGWDEAAACVERTGVSLVRGVELSCAREGITVHLLGYLPDPANEALLAVQRRATESRLTRARARQRLLPEEVLDMMKDAGLFGIERDHRDHTEEDRADVERIARRLKLEVFGSSDYHGLGKPNQLGENLTDQSVLNKLEEEAFLEVLHP